MMHATSAISPEQRYTSKRPCPICRGWDNMRRRKGERCSGYISRDGLYAYCTREQYAGRLDPNTRTSPMAWAHRLQGPCKCGDTHNPAAASLAAGGPPSPARSARVSARAATPTPIRAASASASASTSASTSVSASGEGGAPARGRSGSHQRRGKTPEAVYDYRTADGAILFTVKRWQVTDTDTGEISKTFTQHSPDPDRPGGWRDTIAGIRRVLYRLPELHAADPGAVVYIGEGEKCADALAAAGLLGTTASGGAGNWRHTAASARETLAGRHVVILPDRDPVKPDRPHESCKGQRHAVDVAASLAGAAASIRVLMLPGLDDKGDVYDWLGEGHTGAELAQLAHAAPLWTSDQAPALVPDWGALDGEGDAEGADGERMDRMDAPAPSTRSHARPSRRAPSTQPPRNRLPLLAATPEQNARMVWMEVNDYFTTDEREYLYAHVSPRDGGGEGADLDTDEDGDAGGYYRAVNTWGMPRLVSLYRVDLGGDRLRDETIYRVEWSTQPEAGVHDITGEQLADGSCWALWPGLPISSRRERDLYANIVKAQAAAFHVPALEGHTATGLYRDSASEGASGRWLYLMPDGRCMDRDGERAPVPLWGYDLATRAPRRALAFASMASIPVPVPALADVRALAAWYARVSPQGHLPITVGAALRALVCSIVPARTALLAEGESGCGKTASGKHARALPGPSPYHSEADAHFNATETNIEQLLAPLRDVPALLDNFRIKPTDTAADVRRTAETLDRVILSAESGDTMRGRGGRTGKPQKGNRIATLPLINGEKLPAALVSTLRRVMHLPYHKGVSLDTDTLAEEEAAYQPTLTAIGHAVLRYVLDMLDHDAGELAALITRQEDVYTRRLMAAVHDAPPDGELYRSIPENWARVLTGWRLAEWALGLAQPRGDADGAADGELVAAVYPHVEQWMREQMQLAADGGPASVTAEWLIDATRAELGGTGRAHVRTLAGMPLQPADVGRSGLLSDWGYTGVGGLDGGDEKWLPRSNSEFLAALSEDGLTLYFRSDRWRETLRRRALAERLTWDASKQTFAGMIARLGISSAPASASSEGKDGRNAVVKWIAGRSERCIAVPVATFFDTDTPPIGSENSGKSGKSGKDVAPGHNSSDFEALTAPYRSNEAAVRAVRPSERISGAGDDTGWPDESTAPDGPDAWELPDADAGAWGEEAPPADVTPAPDETSAAADAETPTALAGAETPPAPAVRIVRELV